MSHLSRERLLEAVEATPSAEAWAHLASCARCRGEVEALRRTLDDVRAVDVPEPSPLFWDHLSQRVRDAIAEEPAPAQTSWRSWRRPALAAALILLTAVIVERSARQIDRAPHVAAPQLAATAGSVTAPAPADARSDLDAGDDWEFLVDVATASAGHESADAEASIDTGIGSTELGVADLSAEERRELVRLLNEAMEQRGVSVQPAKGDV